MTASPPSDVLLDRLLTLHPKLIDLTLDRLWRLLAALGEPQRDLPPVVHLAGTNGKGSTLAMIRAGLEADGKSVHAYTSPHLARFHERIRIGGELISEDALSAVLEECEVANDGASITFFEITTAAAFLAFSRAPADVVLIETGLGGRLDATNVIDSPALTVITPVSLDHQQFLGETLGEIAGEKAGILKPDTACVVGPQANEALEVIEERAEDIGAPLLVHGQDWLVRTEHGRLVYEDQRGLLDLDLPALPGAHQIQNAGTAIAALRLLGATDRACQRSVVDVSWPARLQRLRQGPLIERLPPLTELWIDGGHNAAAGEALAAMFDEWHAISPAPLHLIVGMLETKAAADFLAPLAPRVDSMCAVPIPGAEASFPAETLAEMAISAGAKAKPAETVEAALGDILDVLEPPLRVLICGSLYLAGDVLKTHG